MLLQACIVFGYLSRVSTQTPLTKFCFGDVCYINPDPKSGKNWTDAQQICRNFKATLPIADTPGHQRSFEAAVLNLTRNTTRNEGIWLGAKASGSQPNNWTWLDASKYNGTDLQAEGSYSKSYAHLAKTSTEVIAYASLPNTGHSYICYYPTPTDACKNETGQIAFFIGNLCYVKYEKVLSWFSARNSCLADGGDLASFSNISLLEGKIGPNTVWVGLRNSKWNWQNAVTGFPSDVTYTLWKDGQPDDATPTCISTDLDYNFPQWRDRDCAASVQFICQVINTTVTITEPTLNPSSFTLSGTYSTAPSTAVRMPTGSSESTGSVNIPLAVGIGVGIGVPVIILIVVVIVVVIIRMNHRNGAVNGNSQSQNKFASKNSQNNRETSEMNEMENGGTRSDNNSSAQYATIRGAMGLDQDANLVLPSNHGTVYAPLSFNQANC